MRIQEARESGQCKEQIINSGVCNRLFLSTTSLRSGPSPHIPCVIRTDIPSARPLRRNFRPPSRRICFPLAHRAPDRQGCIPPFGRPLALPSVPSTPFPRPSDLAFLSSRRRVSSFRPPALRRRVPSARSRPQSPRPQSGASPKIPRHDSVRNRNARAIDRL